MQTLNLSSTHRPVVRDASPSRAEADPPRPKQTRLDPNSVQTTGPEKNNANASLYFVGTATTLLSWAGLTLMTDPNFLHAGDHVHLGPGVTGTRKTNPAVELDELPNIDVVLLSHYHADHFDQVVEERLRRDLPIVTTPHAKECLVDKKTEGEKFTAVEAVDVWDELAVKLPAPPPPSDADSFFPSSDRTPRLKVTGMPGKHVGDGLLARANDILGAVPPTNGWMLELGYSSANDNDSNQDFECGYRIYISGDTLYVNELTRISELYTHAGKPIDLMLIHLGGTTIPGPSMPLLMVTMDAKQGVQLMQLVQPKTTVPIHFDDYDVFMSPLSDFKKEVEAAGWQEKTVYLDRGEEMKFHVRGSESK